MGVLKGNEVVDFIAREEIEGDEMEEMMKKVLCGLEKHC
ncbi:BrxA/BrxB family bacilliredoxin [Bacillus sp. WP8]